MSDDAPRLSELIASTVASTRFEDLPAAAVEDAKRVLLDSLAVAWPAAGADAVAQLDAYATANGGRGEALLWGSGVWVPAATAALVNGTQAAALDFDCLHDAGTAHANVTTLPAALALAERIHASGAVLLRALVVGDDLCGRLCAATCGSPGWFFSSVYGVFAAAAAGASVLGLDAERVRHALGIALSGAAGSQMALADKSLTKRMQTAFAAQRGVEAALFAAAGISGPREPIIGRAGLSGLYESIDEQRVRVHYGRHWEHGQVVIKKYPSCACNHAAMEAVLALRAGHGLTAGEVARVEVTASQFVERLVGGRYEPGDNPQVAAQFSVPYSVAVMLLYGRLGLPEIAPAFACRSEIRELADRVQVLADPDNHGRVAPVTVRVHTHDGRVLEHTQTRIPGTPADPLGWDDVVAKFHACAGLGPNGLDARTRDALIARIATLEEMDDVTRLFDGLDAWSSGHG